MWDSIEINWPVACDIVAGLKHSLPGSTPLQIRPKILLAAVIRQDEVPGVLTVHVAGDTLEDADSTNSRKRLAREDSPSMLYQVEFADMNDKKDRQI